MADASGTTHWRDTSDYYWRIPAANGTLAGRIPNVIFARPSSNSSSPRLISVTDRNPIAKSLHEEKKGIPNLIVTRFVTEGRRQHVARRNKSRMVSFREENTLPNFAGRVFQERNLLQQNATSRSACSFSSDQERLVDLVEIPIFIS